MQDNIIYIFNRNGVLEAPREWYESLKPEVITTDFEELKTGKYMPLSEEQIAFHRIHPHCNLFHSFYMIPLTIEEQNNQIREIRKGLYKAQSDPLYMAYIKYKELGDPNNAELAYKIWIEKINKIKQDNPYLSEESEEI